MALLGDGEQLFPFLSLWNFFRKAYSNLGDAFASKGNWAEVESMCSRFAARNQLTVVRAFRRLEWLEYKPQVILNGARAIISAHAGRPLRR
jgi:hypothetical protein